ncbi:MAG: AraC family transcriptional regulator [Lysobacterales bacterium]|jgi:AraC-like DNA-binding protein
MNSRHHSNSSTREQGTALSDTGAPTSESVIAGYALAIGRALEYCGVDSRRVFAAAGISESLGNDPLKRLPLATVSRLYRACVEATNNPFFGLTVARFINASTLHALGYGLLASTTLTDFCTRLKRYFGLVSRNARAVIEHRDREVHLRFELLADVSAESQDAWLATVHRLVRLLYRSDFRPVAVELAHPVPNDGDEPYIDYFEAPVQFDRDAVTYVMPRSEMDIALQGGCPELAQFNDHIAAEYLAKLDRADVVANVRARIIELLPSGECSQSRVAEDLFLSPRTLQQRLGDRGTSFHELLNDMRRELATGYLSRSGISVTEITFLLGFTDVSNFTRAFKRWTGMSPTQYREAEQLGSEQKL